MVREVGSAVWPAPPPRTQMRATVRGAHPARMRAAVRGVHPAVWPAPLPQTRMRATVREQPRADAGT
eukprot:4688365-Prymnesium_polylepis.1